MEELIAGLKRRDRRSLSRLLSLVENQDAGAFEMLQQVWPLSRKSWRVGITGPAGAGKSTLVDHLVARQRKDGQRVGVIAVDPSSPFSGGAVLGDRVRMQRHSGDDQVYIRSVGSRGTRGGVSFCTRAFIQILEAYGVDVTLLETVGAGQSETAVVNLVDTTVVVLVPEAGDAIQALKAGLLEIADIFLVNKGDRPEAEQMMHEVRAMLAMGNEKASAWVPPVLLTQAVSGVGVDEVYLAIQQHQSFVSAQTVDPALKAERLQRELVELIAMQCEIAAKQWVSQDAKALAALGSEDEVNLYQVAQSFMGDHFC